jgi:hypothetical protein
VVAIIAFTAVLGGLYMGVQMNIFRGSGGHNFSPRSWIKFSVTALWFSFWAVPAAGGLNGLDTERSSSTSRGMP